LSRLTAILLGLVLFAAGCSAKKALNEPEVQLINAQAFVQKAFPGVSGEVWYFLNYRVEFNIKTKTPVHFSKLVADEQEITVQSVKLGNRLLNPNLGDYISSDTTDVQVHATFPVVHRDTPNKDSQGTPGIPEKLTLHFESGGKSFSHQITSITAEPTEYRPGVGRERE